MADEFPILERPSLILVTGLPYTRCEVMSSLIAVWAKCPWLKHEVILDSLSKETAYHIDNFPSEEDAARLQCLAFDITCSTALFQLSNCAPTQCVVVSSSLLSYKSQLLGLLNIMNHNLSVGRRGRLLIVECLRKNKFLWQREADHQYGMRSWYEPKS